MTRFDGIDYEPVDVAALVESRRVPVRATFPDGTVAEELNARTGTFKLTDIAGNLKGYTHAEHVEYCPTLDEQYRASAPTVPRLRVVTL